MRILVLNGSPKKKSDTFRLTDAFLKGLNRVGEHEVYEEMEAQLSNAGFLIYEHMDADEATDAFLKESGMNAPAGVGYCLAVRKG